MIQPMLPYFTYPTPSPCCHSRCAVVTIKSCSHKTSPKFPSGAQAAAVTLLPARGEGRTGMCPLRCRSREESAPRGHGSSTDTTPKTSAFTLSSRFLPIFSVFPKAKEYCCQYNSSAKTRIKHSFPRTSLRRNVLGQHPWIANPAIWRRDL